MGAIRETSTGQVRILEANHVVGRVPPPQCSLMLSEPYVSGVHAELRWTGLAWELKDLGSRNGTYINGRRIDPATPHPVLRGTKIAFGKLEQEWELVDASSPPVMVVPLAGGTPVVLDGDLIALPSSDDPRATIYRSIDGGWLLESPDESPRPLTNLQTFEAVGSLWRFCAADMHPETQAASSNVGRLEIGRIHLSFAVSRDEEHVHLTVACDGREIDMGERRHNYLLLTLARRRIEDAKNGLPDTSCGWIDQEELAHDPTMAPPQLNIDVFRIRGQFGRAGVIDAAGIIERRTRQLRIGTGRLSEARL